MSDACESDTNAPGGRVEHSERDQQHPRRLGPRRERQCAREGASPREHEHSPTPRHRDDTQNRLDGERDDARDRQQQPDLRVRQRQLVADQRPGGLAGAEDELVEQLDRQQRRHDAAERPPDQESPGRMSSHAN